MVQDIVKSDAYTIQGHIEGIDYFLDMYYFMPFEQFHRIRFRRLILWVSEVERPRINFVEFFYVLLNGIVYCSTFLQTNVTTMSGYTIVKLLKQLAHFFP